MSEANTNYLFVYGTLMQDLDNDMSRFLSLYSECDGQGYLHGKLYEVAGYPGAVLSENKEDKIYGSLFKVWDIDYVFTVLDPYEGIDSSASYPDLYKRLLVDIYLESGLVKNAWVYIYNLDVSQLKLIPSGKYQRK